MRDTTRRWLMCLVIWHGEIQWKNVAEQHELNKFVIQVGEEFGVKAQPQTHYPNRDVEDREPHKRLGLAKVAHNGLIVKATTCLC